MTFYLIKVMRRNSKTPLLSALDHPREMKASSDREFRDKVSQIYGSDILLTYSETPEWR